MSYETVLEQVRSVPEEYLDEVSDMIGYILYRHEKQTERQQKKSGLAEFFGSMQIDIDPLDIQREMRNEWN
ncbi:MAG: hypothetical protein IJP61_11960 [Treponema sp.]|nr:hypothetical protein [Treponema sp.]